VGTFSMPTATVRLKVSVTAALASFNGFIFR
jgi:hypothetical protein